MLGPDKSLQHKWENFISFDFNTWSKITKMLHHNFPSSFQLCVRIIRQTLILVASRFKIGWVVSMVRTNFYIWWCFVSIQVIWHLLGKKKEKRNAILTTIHKISIFFLIWILLKLPNILDSSTSNLIYRQYD